MGINLQSKCTNIIRDIESYGHGVKPCVKGWFLDNQDKLPWHSLYHLSINLLAVWCLDLQNYSFKKLSGITPLALLLSVVQIASRHWYKSLLNYESQNWEANPQVHYIRDILLPGNKLLDLITELLWRWMMNQNRLRVSLFSVEVTIVLGHNLSIFPQGNCSKGVSCGHWICALFVHRKGLVLAAHPRTVV